MGGSYRRHSRTPTPPPGLPGFSEANGEVHGPGVKLRHGRGRAGQRNGPWTLKAAELRLWKNSPDNKTPPYIPFQSRDYLPSLTTKFIYLPALTFSGNVFCLIDC